jgi:non-specific serine/threonine protein kinase
MLGLALHGLARSGAGNPAEGRRAFRRAHAISSELEDTGGIGVALLHLGGTARLARDYAAAGAHYEGSLAAFRRAPDPPMVTVALANLGYVALRQGQPRRAAALFGEALRRAWAAKILRQVAGILGGLAGVAAAARPPEPAARLFGAAEGLRAELGIVLDPTEHAEYDRDLAAARAQRPPAAFAAEWAEGRATPLEQAVGSALTMAEALARGAGGGAAGPSASAGHPTRDGSPLTRRELEVAALLAEGLTNREIAATLIISERTATNHVEHILTKLSLRARAQVAAWVVRHGLLAAESGDRPGNGAAR